MNTIKNAKLKETSFHPMLFSTLMVQGLMNGSKIETRRIITPPPIDNIEVDGKFYDGKFQGVVQVDNHPNWKEDFIAKFNNKKVGDVIWVRETFMEFGAGYLYRADSLPEFNDLEIKWKPSLFMPKSACRYFLKIVDIRMERVQEISEKDAINEGIIKYDMSKFKSPMCWIQLYVNYQAKTELFSDGVSARKSYQSLWEKINGKNHEAKWSVNPWVWVYTFQLVPKPSSFLNKL